MAKGFASKTANREISNQLKKAKKETSNTGNKGNKGKSENIINVENEGNMKPNSENNMPGGSKINIKNLKNYILNLSNYSE